MHVRFWPIAGILSAAATSRSWSTSMSDFDRHRPRTNYHEEGWRAVETPPRLPSKFAVSAECADEVWGKAQCAFAAGFPTS